VKEKKIPKRKCIACNEMKEKHELVRIVKSAEGELSVDSTGKKNGRGCYICNSIECLKQAKKMRKIERTFSMKVPAEIYDALENEIKQ